MHLGSLLESETVVERQLRMSGQQGPRQGHGATVTNKQLKKQNSKKRTQILASVIPALPLRASQNDPQKKYGLWCGVLTAGTLPFWRKIAFFVVDVVGGGGLIIH